MRMRIAISALAIVVLGGGSGVTAGTKLSIQASPAISLEPTDIVVTVRIERDPENRALEIAADSDGYFTKSVVQLDGEQAARTTQVTLKSVPGGDYEVSAVLRRRTGESTTVQQHVMVTSRQGR